MKEIANRTEARENIMDHCQVLAQTDVNGLVGLDDSTGPRTKYEHISHGFLCGEGKTQLMHSFDAPF